MKTQLIAAGIGMLASVAMTASAMAEGPRASSSNSWSSPTASTSSSAPVAVPTTPAEGPRASSGNNWARMSAAASPQLAAVPHAGAPQYQWVESYGHGGRWQGQWEVVR